MPIGTVKWFDAKKGYGFILGPQEGRDIFVHYTHIVGEGFRSLRDGEQVEYDLVESEKGLQARNVRPLGRTQERTTTGGRGRQRQLHNSSRTNR